MKTPILFTTLGYPGSGKTFFSRRFAKDMDLFHLNSDRLRLEMFPTPKFTPAENATVFRMMDFLTEELLKRGVSVIYDANSTLREYRKKLQQIAKRNGAKYLLLWFQTPVEVALKRIKKRRELKSELLKRYHRPIDDDVLYKIRSQEEAPIREPHLILTAAPYRKQKKTVTAFLRKR